MALETLVVGYSMCVLMKKIEADVAVIGAGASGLMCAIEAAKRGRKVVVIERANKPGKKILMSGGGRCNFTNYDVEALHYISHNPHFCKSALSRYTQWDFIGLVSEHQIPYHEREHGQLFCDDSAKDILNMLLSECEKYQVKIDTKREIKKVSIDGTGQYFLTCESARYNVQSVVVATGGLSIPTLGGSAFGYELAKQFGHKVYPTRAGLVPMTLQPEDKEKLSLLSGLSFMSVVENDRALFKENTLITHRGLSGPAILQLSNYWQSGEAIAINTLPDLDLEHWLESQVANKNQQQLKNALSEFLPKRLLELLLTEDLAQSKIVTLTSAQINAVCELLQSWKIKPNGTEGYRTAEVTLGGVDCNEVSSKTFESNKSSGLYFIGEVLDVTGWLGGYNFQWAWASGWCAGQFV